MAYTPLKVGTYVSWRYRAATGHGRIASVIKAGDTAATTEYKIEEFDHHPGEPKYRNHYGSDVTVISAASAGKYRAAGKAALAKRGK